MIHFPYLRYFVIFWVLIRVGYPILITVILKKKSVYQPKNTDFHYTKT